MFVVVLVVVFFKQKTAYEMRISDWSSDVCSSDLPQPLHRHPALTRLVETCMAEQRFAGAAFAIGRTNRRAEFMAWGHSALSHEIGRASCRERVCQYV